MHVVTLLLVYCGFLGKYPWALLYFFDNLGAHLVYCVPTNCNCLNVCHTNLGVQFNYVNHGSSLVSWASPSYPEREKGSGQKGCTNASGWNAIINNSSVHKIEINRHFCSYRVHKAERMRVCTDRT